MKRKILILLAIVNLLLADIAFGATAELVLNWQASQAPDIKGYRLYYSATGQFTFVGRDQSFAPANAPRCFVKSIPAPITCTSAYITAPAGTEIYFILTAFDHDGNESRCSHVLQFIMPPRFKGSGRVRQQLDYIIKSLKD